MQRHNIEVTVGFFVLIGLIALGYLSVKLGEVQLIGSNTYTVTATFPTAGGLQPASGVEIAGVRVGRVEAIRLDDYEAEVTLRLESQVQLQEDSIASIRTRGLIGEKFVRITPGGSEQIIPPGGRLREVETPIDFEDLIGRFIQGKI